MGWEGLGSQPWDSRPPCIFWPAGLAGTVPTPLPAAWPRLPGQASLKEMQRIILSGSLMVCSHHEPSYTQMNMAACVTTLCQMQCHEAVSLSPQPSPSLRSSQRSRLLPLVRSKAGICSPMGVSLEPMLSASLSFFPWGSFDDSFLILYPETMRRKPEEKGAIMIALFAVYLN